MMLSFIPAKTESISLGVKHFKSPSCTPIFWPRAYSDFSVSPSRARRTREAEKARELRVGVSKLPRDRAKPKDDTTAASMLSDRTAAWHVLRIAKARCPGCSRFWCHAFFTLSWMNSNAVHFMLQSVRLRVSQSVITRLLAWRPRSTITSVSPRTPLSLSPEV